LFRWAQRRLLETTEIFDKCFLNENVLSSIKVCAENSSVIQKKVREVVDVPSLEIPKVTLYEKDTDFLTKSLRTKAYPILPPYKHIFSITKQRFVLKENQEH